MIEVRDLHKAFGKVIAVDGATFIARDGEITGLLGPNGAGKTTTLRCLYTLMQPDRGQVLVDGIDAAVDPIAVRRSLGVNAGAVVRLSAGVPGPILAGPPGGGSAALQGETPMKGAKA